MTEEELEKEVEEYLHNNYCCKGSYCGFNTECKEGVRIRCSEFDILKKHLIDFGESRKERIAELTDELKADNDARKFAMAMSEKVEKQLREENAKLKNQLEMSNKVYNDNLDYSHHIEEQLTKAKELLERLLITSCNSDVLNLLPNCSEVLRVRVEAEQFISEVEK